MLHTLSNPDSASDFDFNSKVDVAPHDVASGVITIPDAHLLFSGEYKRSGTDLVLSDDGQTFVVHDYFRAEKRATLYSPDGASLSGVVVEALTGHGQYAQAGTAPAPTGTPIGRVVKVTGHATAIRNGVAVELNNGDNVYKSDVVQAGADSALGISLLDGTAFNLGAYARMVLNEMIYDPNGTQNSSLFSLVQGTISFVAGATAKTGDMKVDTPVATMGIRGTAVLYQSPVAEIAATDGTTKFSILVEQNGYVGSFNLFDKTTGILLATVSQAGLVTLVSATGLGQQATATTETKSVADLQIEQQVAVQVFQIYTLGQQAPQNVANNATTNSSSGSSGTNPGDGTHKDPDKIVLAAGVTHTDIPIPPKDKDTGAPPVTFSVTITVNTPPTIAVTNVVDTEAAVSSTAHFNIADHVTITDPDIAGVLHDIATPYVAGTAVLVSAVGPSGISPATLASLVSIDPATGEVTYDPSLFKFLAVGETAVFTIGFDSSSGPDTVHETLTFTINGIENAPAVDLTPTINEVPIPPLPAGSDTAAQNEIAPAMSHDGRWVVFFSAEQVPNGNNNNNPKGDVFLYDRLTGVTKVLTDYAHIPLASRPQDGTPEHYQGFSISADGSTVVFRGDHQVPNAPSLGGSVATGHHDINHIYVYDRASDSVRLLKNPDNNNTPYDVNDEARIAGGNIVFASTVFAPNNSGPPTRHIYVTDLGGHIQTNITLASLGINDPNLSNPNDSIEFQQADISPNGRYLTFWAVEKVFNPADGTNTPVGDATLYTYDRFNNPTHTAQFIATTTATDNDWWASMSNDGQSVVFQSDKLSASGHMDIFVWDRTTHVSTDITAQANGNSGRASISPDGRNVIFASDATNLVPGDTNVKGDTFVYNLDTHTFQRISVASDGTQGNGDSTLGSAIGFGGKFAAFGSTAGNLVPGDNNGTSDIFVVDRSAGTVGVVVEDDTTPAFPGALAGTLSTHGAFTFNDADLTDHHTMQLMPGVTIDTSGAPGFSVPVGGYGTFTPTLVDTNGTGHGHLEWTFTVDNALVQGLNAFQRVVQVYTVQIDDGHGGVVTQNVTIAIAGIPDAAVADAHSYLAGYTLGDPGVAIDPNLTLTDIDSQNLQSARIAINNFASGDTLIFATHGNIQGNYNPANGVLSLFGQASVADYQAAIESISYQNINTGASVAARTISYTVNDGFVTSAPVTSEITVSAAVPTTNPASATGDEDTIIPVILSGTGVIASFAFTTVPAHGTFYTDALAQHPIVNGTPLPAVNDQETLYFKPDADFNGQLTFQYVAVGPNNSPDLTPATGTINVTPVNDAPVVTPLLATVTEDSPLPPVDLLTGTSDPDGDTLQIAGFSSSASLNGNPYVGSPISYSLVGSVLTIASGQFNWLQAGDHLVLTAAYNVIDGHGGTTPDTAQLSITGVNDAPMITGASSTGGAPSNGLSNTAASYLTAGHDLINGLGGSSGFGEQSLGRNDDGSTGQINITSVFGAAGLNFFGHTYTSLYINNNGNITFNGPNGTFTPRTISADGNNPIIAPFWADVDTRGGATSPTPGGHSTGSNLVYYDLDAANHVMTITWDDVGYYGAHTNPLNAFQLQLIGTGDGNFDIVFRYESINWTTGDFSGGSNGLGGSPARAGYSAGDNNPNHYFELPQSGNQASMLALESTDGNTHTPGVDVFQVQSGNVTSAPVANGTIRFTDPDTADTHTATAQANGTLYNGTFALDDPNGNHSNVTETNGSGSVAWHFSLTNQQFVSILANQPVTQSYDVTIQDNAHVSATQTVSVTVGTNAADSFVFNTGIGADTIVNFQNGSDSLNYNNGADSAHLGPIMNSDQISHILSILSANSSGDAVLNFGHGDSATLAGVHVADLQNQLHLA